MPSPCEEDEEAAKALLAAWDSSESGSESGWVDSPIGPESVKQERSGSRSRSRSRSLFAVATTPRRPRGHPTYVCSVGPWPACEDAVQAVASLAPALRVRLAHHSQSQYRWKVGHCTVTLHRTRRNVQVQGPGELTPALLSQLRAALKGGSAA